MKPVSRPVCGAVHPGNPRFICRRDPEHRDEDFASRAGRGSYTKRWHRGMVDDTVLAWQPSRTWEASHSRLRLVK